MESWLPRIGLANRRHGYSRQSSRRRTSSYQRTFKCNRVYDGGQHSHRVSGCTINPARGTNLGSPNNVPAPDHNCNLVAETGSSRQIGSQCRECLGVQPVTIRRKQSLAGKLYQNPFDALHDTCSDSDQKKGGARRRLWLASIQALTPDAAATSAAKSLSCFSMPSPKA